MHPDPDLARAVAAVPEWDGLDPVIAPIEAGRTNRNYRVDVGGRSFFLRLAGKETRLLGIDRGAEQAAARGAAAAGVGPEVVAVLPEHDCLITRWVDAEPLGAGDLEREEVIEDVVSVVRAIHAGPDLPWSFSAFRIVEDYRRVSLERGVAIPEAYDDAHAHAAEIERALRAAPSPLRPCHNDLLSDNFLRGEDRIWLVDYEYAGMGDPFFDLGNLSVNNAMSEDAQEALLRRYLGAPTDADRARLQLMRIMSDFREAMWGVVQQGLSALDIDYVAYADTHFDRLAISMSDDRFRAWLRAAGGEG